MGFRRKPDNCFFQMGVNEVKGDSPEGIGAKRRPLTSEGRQPLSSFVDSAHRIHEVSLKMHRINRYSYLYEKLAGKS
jgi:hypothetical protein